jgi:hypothetical protein
MQRRHSTAAVLKLLSVCTTALQLHRVCSHTLLLHLNAMAPPLL